MLFRSLLVDDDEVNLLLTAAALRERGFDVAEASSGSAALGLLSTRTPDVVVLDVEMPRMDGITFLRQVMTEKPTPVVMCSTLTEAGCETTLQALAAGCCVAAGHLVEVESIRLVLPLHFFDQHLAQFRVAYGTAGFDDEVGLPRHDLVARRPAAVAVRTWEAFHWRTRHQERA